jgi:hypothetical protein
LSQDIIIWTLTALPNCAGRALLTRAPLSLHPSESISRPRDAKFNIFIPATTR